MAQTRRRQGDNRYRLERIKHEFVGLRDAQDALMDRIDTYEGALLGLTEAVAANHDKIMATMS